MADIRLKTDSLELDGEKWELRCSMNVLADVQEAFGGDLLEALNPAHTIRSALVVGAAMLNEAAALRGREDRFTPEELGRRLPTVLPGLFVDKVLDLVADAIGIEPVTDGDDGKKKQDPAMTAPTGA